MRTELILSATKIVQKANNILNVNSSLENPVLRTLIFF